MDYEKMWKALKKIVEEEIDIYAGDPEHVLPEKSEYFRGQADEADYLLGEMKILEIKEMLEETESEAKNEIQ